MASDTAWNSVVEEIKEVCRLYCLRNHDFQTEKNIQTGEEFLIISFYHVKKMVSPETLEILNADTIRRLEQLGYTNNRSYYKGFSFIIEVEGKTTAEQKDKKSLAEDTPLGIQSQESEEMTPGELKEMNIRDRFSLWRQRIMSIFKGIPILHFKNTDPILQ
ncbi:MAG: hypothetical protein JW774_08065 [Candidatus Aureabacteria bacterium]|nr:hypothetical protein [Candidatus Auribacterota bacterium]